MLWVPLFPWRSCAEVRRVAYAVLAGVECGLPSVTAVGEGCLLPGGAVVVGDVECEGADGLGARSSGEMGGGDHEFGVPACLARGVGVDLVVELDQRQDRRRAGLTGRRSETPLGSCAGGVRVRPKAPGDRVADLPGHRWWSVFGKKRGRTKKAGPPVHDDLVRRDFTTDGPNRLWLTDITEHDTSEGKLYLCAIKDVFSRRIVGYSIDDRMKSRLAVAALDSAVARRDNVAGCILHSDRGSQGGFNWSSRHLDHGGVRWGETRRRCRSCLRVRDGSGRRIGRCDRRCVRQADRSRLVRCSGTSGGGSRRE